MNTIPTGLVRHLRSLASRQAHGDWSDQQLLEMFLRERSESSFAALVRRHGPMVLSVCRRVLRNSHDAEDAFQAAFLVFARRAGSIRKHESVSSWLHGVAYHVAEKQKLAAARRAARERNRQRPPVDDPMDEITWRELRAVLDEELRKLPERYRAPLVLCYLEGRTQDEAARQLGWSKGTFRRRLEQGRGALGRRLTRRGLTLSAALSAPLLADAAAQATVPPMLVETAVRAGVALAMGRQTTGLVSAQVAALAGGGTKMKMIVAVLVALGMAAGGVLMHPALGIKLEAAKSAAPPVPQARAVTPRPNDKGEAVEIKGRVFDPDGKPLAGARLFLLSEATRKEAGASARATTDKDGRFHFTARPVDFGSQGRGTLVATAEGLGPDWTDVKAKGKQEEVTLRLVPDDVPIVGRVLDLEGRPIAGVKVKILRLAKREGGADLASWVEKNIRMRAKGRLMHEEELKVLPAEARVGLPTSVTTKADGRFRFTGVGRERVVRLMIQGPDIEWGNLWALTRPGPARGWLGGQWGLYGAAFDWLAGPCKPITGTVRDKSTGQPVPGIHVSCPRAIGTTAVTDRQGRYRIAGVGKDKTYLLVAWGVPFLDCRKREISDTPGLAPLTVDLQVERGIEITGRLLDKSTGGPVNGRVSYWALTGNPNAKNFQTLDKSTLVTSMIRDVGRTGPDGTFSAVAIPGPGLLVVRADEAERFPVIDMLAELRKMGVSRSQVAATGYNVHAVVRVGPTGKEPRVMIGDIALAPARKLGGSLVGPDGKPRAGALAVGLSTPQTIAEEPPPVGEAFTVTGLAPHERRHLIFYHRGEKIGKKLQVHADAQEPMVVKLEPLGAVAGRVLDAAGHPLRGRPVILTPQDPSVQFKPFGRLRSFAFLDLKGTTDRHGRFRLEGALPGITYRLLLAEQADTPDKPVSPSPHGDPLLQDLTIESGKTKDLGDLKSKQTPGERPGK